MAGRDPSAQAPRDPREPSAQDETLQTLPSLVNLRNLRNPAPGLAADLVNFARLVQFLENQLDSDLWSTSDAENEQGAPRTRRASPRRCQSLQWRR